MRIFLIGMMGSGKSTIGKLLAQNLDYLYIDSDQQIEASEGLTIHQIFNQKGETYFRKKEKEFLSGHLPNNSVISTGGGMPCFDQNLILMKNLGIVIFLNVGISTIFARISQDNNRPLITLASKSQKMERLRQLKKERKQCYESADFKVNSYGEPEQIVNRILKLLKKISLQ